MASIEGKLSRVGLTDIIQMECLSGRQGTIAVSALHGTGYIDYTPGRIIHVEFDGDFDKEAMIRMLVLDDGWFRVEARRSQAESTIQQNWQNFLMDCVVEADEREDAQEADGHHQDSSRKPLQGLLDQLNGAVAVSFDRENTQQREWFEEAEQRSEIESAWQKIEALTSELGPLLNQGTFKMGGKEAKDLVYVLLTGPQRTVKAAFDEGSSLIDSALSLDGALHKTL